MAKVATGQRLDRLPPGKIFGMAVTEPNAHCISTPVKSANQQILNEASDSTKETTNESITEITVNENNSITRELNFSPLPVSYFQLIKPITVYS